MPTIRHLSDEHKPNLRKPLEYCKSRCGQEFGMPSFTSMATVKEKLDWLKRELRCGTYEQLAVQMGFSLRSISRWRADGKPPHEENQRRFAVKHGLDPKLVFEFFEDGELPPPFSIPWSPPEEGSDSGKPQTPRSEPASETGT